MKKKIFFLMIVLFLFVYGCKTEMVKMQDDTMDAPEAPAEADDMMDAEDTAEADDMDAPEDTADADDMDAEEPVSYVDLSPADSKKLIDDTPELIILDVSPLYANGHLPGAINYYIGDGSLDAAIPGLDPEAIYLVYCHVDSASIGGAQKLIDAGFKNVYRLEGNYAAWVAEGYPVE